MFALLSRYDRITELSLTAKLSLNFSSHVRIYNFFINEEPLIIGIEL